MINKEKKLKTISHSYIKQRLKMSRKSWNNKTNWNVYVFMVNVQKAVNIAINVNQVGKENFAILKSSLKTLIIKKVNRRKLVKIQWARKTIMQQRLKAQRLKKIIVGSFGRTKDKNNLFQNLILQPCLNRRSLKQIVSHMLI